jgi:hypothetical protein
LQIIWHRVLLDIWHTFFTIEKLTEVTPAQTTNTVVNGSNDNGLDAIHFDRPKNILWVVQSIFGDAEPPKVRRAISLIDRGQVETRLVR